MIARTLPHRPPRTCPPLHPHPHRVLPLPSSSNHLALLVLSAPSVPRTGTLQWSPRPPRHGRGSRLSDGLPPVQMTMSLKSPRNGGKLSASLVTSVGSARSHVGSRPKEVWIQRAGEFLYPFRLPYLPFYASFGFGNLTGCSLPILANASPVEWIANSRPNPVAGHVVPTVRPLLKSTHTKGSGPGLRVAGWIQPYTLPSYLSFVTRDLYVPFRYALHYKILIFFAV